LKSVRGRVKLSLMFSTRRSNNRGSVTSFAILVICAVIAILLVINRQYIIDQISVWQYQPSSDVAAIAEQSGMSGNGTFYFYASHPSIENAADFNKKCSRKEMSTAILGCYNGQEIFIYNVTDPRLEGIQEVTAAHEMLHAAYARLSTADKESVNKLLASEYEKLKSDKEFAERMAFYDRTEPGERDNELHSIIGTEVTSVTPELETYYRKYFSDRKTIVSLHEKYAAVFKDLQKRGEEISHQLTELATSIERDTTQYNSDVSRLNQDISAFNARASGGGFGSDAAFTATRSSLVNRAEQLDEARNAINASIEQYNQLREELAVVASESDALNRSIDSSLAPAPSL
jgi:hypothetical protein